MEEGVSQNSINTQMFSGYDSDQTVVDDSIPGSEEEDDELSLKRLYLVAGLYNRRRTFGQQSPEIQRTSYKSVTEAQTQIMKTTRQVCELSEEELSQSLLRNWTKDPVNLETRSVSSKGNYDCKTLVDDTYFSGLCEDSQYLIQTECEVRDTNSGRESPSLLSNIMIKHHHSPGENTQLLEKCGTGKLQNQAQDVLIVSEIGDAETKPKETLTLDHSEGNLYKNDTSEILLGPLSIYEDINLMTDIADSQQYSSFVVEATEDNMFLTPEVLESINSMQISVVETYSDHLEDTVVSDHSTVVNDGEDQMITTQCIESNNDLTQLSTLTMVHDNGNHIEMICEETLPILEANKETKEGTSESENNSQQPVVTENCTLSVSNVSSHCPGAEQQSVKWFSLHNSKEKCTETSNDSTATLDSASCSQPTSSILNNAKAAVGGNPSDTCSGARRNKRISNKAESHVDQTELQYPGKPPKQRNMGAVNCGSLTSENAEELKSGKSKTAQQEIRQNFHYQLRKTSKIPEKFCSYIKEKRIRKRTDASRRKKRFTEQSQKHITVNNNTNISTEAESVILNSNTGNSKERKIYSTTQSNMFHGKNVNRDHTHCNKTASVKQNISSTQLENIHKRNFMGETKLHQASKRGDLKLVNALITAGIDVNQKDNAGWTAIHEAAFKGYTEIIQALLQAGADVNSKGLDGIRPIHEAAFCDHLESAEVLLDFGANPYERDDAQKNAFDKSCSDKMLQLLKSHITRKGTSTKNGTPGTEDSQLKNNSASLSDTKKSTARAECSLGTLATLEEIENIHMKLLSTELKTSEDADKYIEEMRWIQDVLNKIVILQKNERDTVAKKYRASVDSFKQGILRDKLAELACRQKTLLKVVHNQKDVAQKIMAYQQTKRSDANNGEKSSSLRYSDTSPGRNTISALCTANEWLDSNIANGYTMVTNMPAVCRVPHVERSHFQTSFNKEDPSLEISRTRAAPNSALVSKSTVQHKANMTGETENYFCCLNSCSAINPINMHKERNLLEASALGSESPDSISVNSTLNITDKHNIIVKKINCQTMAESHHPCHSVSNFEDSNQVDMTDSDFMEEATDSGRAQHTLTVQRNAGDEQSFNPNTIDNPLPIKQICAETTRIRKVSLIKLIKMGILKPGDDVLCFNLQDYSHKASLLPDGCIKDGFGAIHRDPSQWVKALLGSNISVSWKYVADKVTYFGKTLSSFMRQEDFEPKECNRYTAKEQPTVSTSLRPSAHAVLQVTEILLIDKSEFFPSHMMDQYWEEFMNRDSQDF